MAQSVLSDPDQKYGEQRSILNQNSKVQSTVATKIPILGDVPKSISIALFTLAASACRVFAANTLLGLPRNPSHPGARSFHCRPAVSIDVATYIESIVSRLSMMASTA